MNITDQLRRLRVHHEVMLHGPASCASRLASRLHFPGREVSKAVLLSTGSTYLVAVVPSTHRLDLGRLQAILGMDRLTLATVPDLVKVFHDCEVGAVPPFGRFYGVPTVVDTSLAGVSEVVCAGNLRHESVRMRYRDFEAVVEPVRVKFAELALPGGKSARRRAG